MLPRSRLARRLILLEQQAGELRREQERGQQRCDEFERAVLVLFSVSPEAA